MPFPFVFHNGVTDKMKWGIKCFRRDFFFSSRAKKPEITNNKKKLKNSFTSFSFSDTNRYRDRPTGEAFPFFTLSHSFRVHFKPCDALRRGIGGFGGGLALAEVGALNPILKKPRSSTSPHEASPVNKTIEKLDKNYDEQLHHVNLRTCALDCTRLVKVATRKGNRRDREVSSRDRLILVSPMLACTSPRKKYPTSSPREAPFTALVLPLPPASAKDGIHDRFRATD